VGTLEQPLALEYGVRSERFSAIQRSTIMAAKSTSVDGGSGDDRANEAANIGPRSAADQKTSRRGFSLAIGMISLAVTHLLWLLGLARFMFPNILTEPPSKFKVGFPGDYAPGQVETKFKAQFGVWVVRHQYEGQQQIYALKTVCTHLGCTPIWLEGEQKFKCPCHGSGFYKDGIHFEGPAPRPLERFSIQIADDGQLEVDKSRTFQEELGQWKDPASRVLV
jgi:cytochrome b6-f complex iron-sulfur subunit